MRRSTVLIIATLLAIATLVGVDGHTWANAAHAADRTDWATGNDFRSALAEPCTILWAANPLRKAFKSLSSARKVAILVDRRVDPSQKLDVSLNGVPLKSALQAIAKARGLGVAALGAVVYVGPPAAAERLRQMAATLDRDTRHLPAALQSKYRQTEPLAWEDLATPRELIERLADASGLDITGQELVPHDLWAAADLPPMTLTDRLALIAVQFDLGLKIANRGKQIELVRRAEDPPRQPLPEQDALPVRSIPRRAPQANPQPPTKLELTRIDRISVKDKPLGSVLKQLANQLGLELKIDQKAIAAADISLDQNVSLLVEHATVDELLRQLLKSTGLTFHRRNRVVEIVPAE